MGIVSDAHEQHLDMLIRQLAKADELALEVECLLAQIAAGSHTPRQMDAVQLAWEIYTKTRVFCQRYPPT
jgi:hypothetical protein